MSGTRRQSEREAEQTLSPARQPGASKILDRLDQLNRKLVRRRSRTEDDVFEDSESDSGAESDASEYAKRSSKRQKTTKKSTVAKKSIPQKSPAKRRKSAMDLTCYIIALPLDFLLQVFCRLEPKDLIHLSRTNHAFRSHLRSGAANIVWKKAREIFDGPDCPSDLSERHWAHLLYGDPRCQSCDANNVQRVDFGLRRRACTNCLKAKLTLSQAIPGRTARSQFYWKPDIETMATKLDGYERNVQMRILGAQKKLENFTAERIALVKTTVEVCEWSQQLALRRETDLSTKVDARYNAIKDRFIELGYTEADISDIKDFPSVSQPTQLTTRVWNKIYPELEPIVRARKDKRLETEQYKKTLVPTQWRFLPPTVTHFDEAVEPCLPDVSWTVARKAELVHLRNRTWSFWHPHSNLDLATDVFECAQPLCSVDTLPLVIGVARLMIRPSDCLDQDRPKFFQARIYGSFVPGSLANPFAEDSTAAEMDNLDLRFLCIACKPQPNKDDSQTYSAFSWRAAVSHFVSESHAAPLWRVLNGPETQRVKRSEFGADPTLSWACNRCPHHLDNYQTFARVAEHVKTIPRHAVDLIRCLDLPRPPATFTTVPGLSASHRAFKLQGVESHLQAVHKVTKPVPNRDWKRPRSLLKALLNCI
ncbi:hypothetical protein B0H13DRAFT_2067421 [Mycena leptocephala]|nr:hypothetical protein B0H13DRAFT_2067421 [Mycena leptocephala]